jgi:phage major head subunit gpT-like protein
MLVTRGNVAAIFKGYSVTFWEAFAASAPPLAEGLAMFLNSTGLSEDHNWLTATPGIRELVDEAVINDMAAQNYNVVNKEYEETLGLKEIEVKTDKYGILAPRLRMLGANGRAYPDELLARLIVKGFDGSAPDYMGGQFFDANKKAHPDAQAFTNVTTGRLTATRYEAGRANLLARTNEKGRPLNLGMDLRLIVSPTYDGPARRILEAERAENGATNVMRGTAKLVTWPWLNAVGLEHAWFLADFGNPMKPFIHQELIPWTNFTVDNPQDNYVLRFHKFLYQIYSARAMAFGFPEVIYASDGTVV